MSFDSDPIRREESVFVNPLTAEAVELAFRDACESAVLRASSLALALRCYRSVIVLALRLRVERADAGLPAVWEARLLELLDRVLIVAGEQLRSESMPVEARLRLYGSIAGLARAAHRARAGMGMRRQDPLRREGRPGSREMAGSGPAMTGVGVGVDAKVAEQDPIRREGCPGSREMAGSSPAMTGVEGAAGAEEPAPLSVWRNDHTEERDQKAHERLRIVLEDRVFSKSRAEAQRLIAEKAARAAATAHAP